MLTKSNLQELLDFEAQHLVLSVYLNTEPSQGNADVYRLKLRSMLKDADVPEAEVDVIERYFDQEYDWAGRSVALFSCVPEDFFRVYPLAVPVRSRVRYNAKRPHVKPLANLLDSYGHYGVALVDKQGARLFSFHLGDLREQEGILGEDVQRIKHGGGSQAGGQRGHTGQKSHPRQVAERNLKSAAQFAAQFFADHKVRRVMIGGTDKNIAQFRAYLPKKWQSLVVGTFPMSMAAGHDEVLEKAIETGSQAERQREEQLVDAVITNASKGQGGIVNLDDTLSAAHEGRVQTLLVQDGYRSPGYRCQGCSYLTTQEMETCPFCGGNFEEIPDAVELVVQNIMRQGGNIEFVSDNETLQEYGNIGALLRY